MLHEKLRVKRLFTASMLGQHRAVTCYDSSKSSQSREKPTAGLLLPVKVIPRIRFYYGGLARSFYPSACQPACDLKHRKFPRPGTFVPSVKYGAYISREGTRRCPRFFSGIRYFPGCFYPSFQRVSNKKTKKKSVSQNWLLKSPLVPTSLAPGWNYGGYFLDS